MDILPTHTCFDDAFEYIELIILHKEFTLNEIRDHFFIVHAICKLPTGKLYAHAWVEHKNECTFKGILNNEAVFCTADKKEFYAQYDVQEFTKYSMERVRDMNFSTKSFGPWIEKYKALTGKDSTKYRADGSKV